MCTLLDYNTYELVELLIQAYDSLTNEADRRGISLDTSSIDETIRRARRLVMQPSDDSYHDNDPTTSYQNLLDEAGIR